MLPILYTALHFGKKSMPDSKDAPKLIDVVRNSDTILEGYPNKTLPRGEEAYLLTSRFTTELDEILTKTPKTMEQAVSDAAFSYYVLCRIHPFPDGNGRIGRMIAKLIFKKAGLKDPVFHDQRWYGGDRSEHIDAIEKVDETNNLAFMEIFFAKSIIGMYDPIREFSKYRAVSRLINEKQKQAKVNDNKMLSDIWGEFAGLPEYEKLDNNSI
jgi:fido (protein-threonine AMPylation protein)